MLDDLNCKMHKWHEEQLLLLARPTIIIRLSSKRSNAITNFNFFLAMNLKAMLARTWKY